MGSKRKGHAGQSVSEPSPQAGILAPAAIRRHDQLLVAAEWLASRAFEICLAGYGAVVLLSFWTGFAPALWGTSESARGLAIMAISLAAAPSVVAAALLLFRKRVSPEARRLWYLGIATACGAMALASWTAYVSTSGPDRSIFPSPSAGSSSPAEYVVSIAESHGADESRLDNFEWTCILGVAAGFAGASALAAQLEKESRARPKAVVAQDRRRVEARD